MFSDGGVAVHQTGTINKILMALPKLGAKLSLVRSRFDWPHLSLEGRSAELCGAVLWMAFTVYVHSAPLTFANTRRTSFVKGLPGTSISACDCSPSANVGATGRSNTTWIAGWRHCGSSGPTTTPDSTNLDHPRPGKPQDSPYITMDSSAWTHALDANIQGPGRYRLRRRVDEPYPNPTLNSPRTGCGFRTR